RCSRLWLNGLPLGRAPEWLAKKERVLDGDQALTQARHDIALLQATHQAVRDTLADALANDLGQSAHGSTLATLRVRAEAYIRDADAAKVRQEAWLAQIAELRPVLQTAQQTLLAAQDEQVNWQQ